MSISASSHSEPLPDIRFLQKAMGGICAVLIVFIGFIILIAGVKNIEYAAVLASFLMISLWAGLGVTAIAQCAAIITPGPWRLDIRAVWVILAVLISGITLPLFEMFKQHILPARGFPFDPALAAIDRFLFLGHDPWMLTHFLFGSLSATLFLDAIYALWLPMMFAFPMVAVMAARDIRLRAQLLICWIASWILIAGAGAWAFGSAGPCYYNALVGPEASFLALSEQLTRLAAAANAQGLNISALDFQSLLLAGHSDSGFLPAGGISAMPSMHVAMATLFALGGRQVSRGLGWAMWIYAVLIWIGSVHLGWHYAVDGVAGAAMMVGVWWLSGKIVRRL